VTVTLPQNIRDEVLDAFEAYLTAGLIDVYGSGRIATRDANDMSQSVAGEATPRIYILEEQRQREDDKIVPHAELELSLLCLYRRIGYTEKLIQTELNKLELFIDYMISRVSELGTHTSGKPVSVYCIQKANQISYGKAGQDEGWLEYHCTLSYPVILK